ncbi:MAG: hypothetical protein OEZ13_07765 [Spirochaetia bacterium]|nr:hypothetical protein [Spirochaetia bacterium]
MNGGKCIEIRLITQTRGDMKEEENGKNNSIFDGKKLPSKETLIKNKILYLEPRNIRHQDRIVDLFRALFKRK